MSSSKVVRRFSFTEQSVPIGNQEYLQRVETERRDASPLEQRFRQLQEQAVRNQQRAYQDGFAAGQKQGLAQGQAEAEKVRQHLQGVAAALEAFREQLYEQSRGELTELAFALADRIIGSRSEREQELVIETVARCVSEILDKAKIKIRVNSRQVDFIKENLESIRALDESISQISIEPDQRVAPGGCIVETDSGTADGRLQSQLEMLRRGLLAQES
ncbi:MAG: FliH/SctL family protein [bacterium]